MTESFRLEVRKQRLVLAGFSGALICSLPLVAAAAKAFGHPLRQAFDAALFFWVYVGLPIAACVMGASAGAGLRRTGELEASLPVSPARRAWAAFAAAAAQLLLLLALVSAAVAALSSSPGEAVAGGMGDSRLFVRGAFLLLSYGLLYGLGASFVLSYLSGHGVAGGLAGGVLGVCSYAALGAGSMLDAVFGLGTPFLARAAAAVAATLAGTAWSFGAAARWVERERRGWGKPVAAAAAAAGGVVLSAWLAASSFMSVVGGLYPFRVQGAPLGSAPPRFSEQGRRAAQRGLLLASRRGDLARILPDGSLKTLIPGDEHSIFDLPAVPLWTRLTHYLWDDEGTLWVLVRGDPRHGRGDEVWRGPAEGPLTLAFGVPRDITPTFLMRGKDGIGVAGFDHEGYRGFSAFTKDGKPAFVRRNGFTVLEKLPGSVEKPDVEEFLKTGAYYLMKDGGKERFSIPTAGRGSIAYLQGGDTFLFVPEKGGRRFKLQALPDGTLAGWRERWSAVRFTPGKGFDAPLDVSAALQAPVELGAPRIVRWSPESLWIIEGGRRLLKLEASKGGLEDSWELPAGPKGAELYATLDGIFCDTGRELFFVGWDKTTRKLSLR